MGSGQLVVMTFHPDGSGKAKLSFIPLSKVGHDATMDSPVKLDAVQPAVDVITELLGTILKMSGSEYGLKGAEVEVWWIRGSDNERLWPPIDSGEAPEAAKPVPAFLRQNG